MIQIVKFGATYMELHTNYIELRESHELALHRDDAIKCKHIAILYNMSKR